MALGEKTTHADVGGVRVLVAASELDPYTVPEFRQAQIDAIAAGHYRQVVDLSRTTYIDSTGLGVLVGSLKRTKAHGGWLRLAAPAEAVVRLLQTCGLDRVFEIFPSVEAALSYGESAAEVSS